MLSPLIREPLTVEDVNDLAIAIEKVLEHADEITRGVAPGTGVFTPVSAANEGRVR